MGVALLPAVLFGLSTPIVAQVSAPCVPLESVNNVKVSTPAIAVNASGSVTLQFAQSALPVQVRFDNNPAQPSSAPALSEDLQNKHFHTVTVQSANGCSSTYSIVAFDLPAGTPPTTTATPSGVTYSFAAGSNAALNVTVPTAGGPVEYEATLGPTASDHVEVRGAGLPDAVPTSVSWSIVQNNSVLFNQSALPVSLNNCGRALPAFTNSTAPVSFTENALDAVVTIRSVSITCDAPFHVAAHLDFIRNGTAAIALQLADTYLNGNRLQWTSNSSVNLGADVTLNVQSGLFAAQTFTATGTLAFNGLHAQSAEPVTLAFDSQKIALQNAQPISVPIGQFTASMSAFSCSRLNPAGISCSGTGQLTLPPVGSATPGAVGVNYNAGGLQLQGNSAAVGLGKYNLTIPQFTLSVTDKQRKFSLSRPARLTGPELSATGLELDNLSITDENGSATYKGDFSTAQTVVIGDVFNVSNLKGSFANNGIGLTFDAAATLKDNSPNKIYDVTLKAAQASLSLPFDGSAATYKLGLPEVYGSILGREVDKCPRSQSKSAGANADDSTNETTFTSDTASVLNACVLLHLTPNGRTASDAVRANLGFEHRGTSFVLARGDVTFPGPQDGATPAPLRLRLGGGYANIKALQLAYGDDFSVDVNEPWFDDLHLDQTCKPFLQGVMTVSTDGLVNVGKATDVTSSVSIGPHCMFGEAIGAVYVDAGPNASAVVEKLAIAHVPAMVAAPADPPGAANVRSVAAVTQPTKYNTLVAASGRLQIANVVLSFDKIGYENVDNKVTILHQFNPWKTVGYSAAQNASQILTGLGALIFAIFHH